MTDSPKLTARQQEILELISPEKSIKDKCLSSWISLIILSQFELVSNPIALLSVSNMHVFNSNLLGVGAFEVRDKFSESPVLLAR